MIKENNFKRVFTKVKILKIISEITLFLNSIQNNTEHEVVIRRHRKKRSLDANAYCWYMCQELAEKLSDNKVIFTKEEVYIKHIKEVGSFKIYCVQENEVERFKELWRAGRIGWVADAYESKIEGCKKVFAYYGSSVYDTKQMSRLIDSLVEECKLQGIETITRSELDLLKKEWEK